MRAGRDRVSRPHGGQRTRVAAHALSRGQGQQNGGNIRGLPVTWLMKRNGATGRRRGSPASQRKNSRAFSCGRSEIVAVPGCAGQSPVKRNGVTSRRCAASMPRQKNSRAFYTQSGQNIATPRCTGHSPVKNDFDITPSILREKLRISSCRQDGAADFICCAASSLPQRKTLCLFMRVEQNGNRTTIHWTLGSKKEQSL